MINKLDKIIERYNFLTQEVSKPEVIADNRSWQKLVKEHSDLVPIVEVYEKLKKYNNDLIGAEELLKTEKDQEMIDMLKEEVNACKTQIENVEEELKILLLPKDVNDDKNVIIEVRAGAGGDEAGLFGAELVRMYQMYAERVRFKTEVLNYNDSELGGIKEAVIRIEGNGVYSKLKFESGVHRVQRVPETESQGRVHTSTVTVAVLPELEEVEFEIQDKDLKIDTYRASGAGGQHVNKTESAIRITHLPTNIVVACQEERSQIKNRDRAMTILKSKLYDFYQGQKDKEYADTRKNQVGTGDRSERIRTYNFPQGRITDHRINFTAYNLLEFMNGDIEELLTELAIADQKAKLENLNS